MLRNIARFILWEHLIATLWISGIIFLIAVLNQFGLVYPVIHALFRMDVQSYQTIDAILGPIGLLSFIVFFLGYALNRKRRAENQSENN